MKEILTVGKFVLGGAGAALRPRRGRRRRPPATSSASWRRPQAINELVKVGLVRDQTGWMLDILGDPAQTGVGDRRRARGDAGQRDARAGRARCATETDVDLAAVVVNRVLPELFGRGEEEVFERLREPERPSRAGRARSAAPVEPVLDGAELAVTLRRTRAAHLDPPARRAARRHRRCSTCPSCSRAATASGPPARSPRPSARSWGTDGGRAGAADAPRPASLEQLLAAKEIVIHCGSGGVGKTTTAAAAAAMAAVHLGGKVLVLTVDPATRLANALGLEQFGNVETQVPAEAFAAAGVEPRGELWAAMLDTKQ